MKQIYLVGRINEKGHYIGLVHAVSTEKQANELKEFIDNLYEAPVCCIERTILT